MDLQDILNKKLSDLSVKEILLAVHAYLEHRQSSADEGDLTPEQQAEFDEMLKRFKNP